MAIMSKSFSISQYLSWFLPVQWNIYIFKCRWTAIRHRKLQEIINDSGIAKISSYKSFHFFSYHLSWMICPCLFHYLLSSRSQLSHELLQSTSVVVWVARTSCSREGRLQSALNPYLVPATSNLHLLWYNLFCCLLGGLILRHHLMWCRVRLALLYVLQKGFTGYLYRLEIALRASLTVNSFSARVPGL